MSARAARVLVLTGAEAISDDRLTSFAARWTRDVAPIGPPRRLGPSAAEFDATADAPLSAIRAELGPKAVDANLLPVESRRKRLLIADMDGTMTPVECIDEIADFAGVKPQVAAITAQAMAGALDFEAALTARVALLRGLPVATLDQVYAERVALSPGASTLVRTMRAAGAVTALVSGGFTFFTERVAAAAGFAQHQANTLLAADGRLSGTVGRPILGREAKREALDRLLAEAGLTPHDALAVGDGANDLAMLERAGLGVAYRAKPAVASVADARIDHADLTALLHLQGLRAEEFVV